MGNNGCTPEHACGCTSPGGPALLSNTSSGPGAPTMASGHLQAEGLLPQLMSVEGKPNAQDKLYSTKKTFGCLLIASLEIPARQPDALDKQPPGSRKPCCLPRNCMHGQALARGFSDLEPCGEPLGEEELRRQLSIIGYLRGLLHCRVWSEQVRLVKVAGNKFVAFSHSVISMLGTASRIAQLASNCCTWLERRMPELGTIPPVRLRMAMEAGDVLLLPGDCYGEPMDVALMLGCQLANPGELLLGPQCRQAACSNMALARLMSCLDWTEKSADLLGAPVEYSSAGVDGLADLLPPSLSLPGPEELSCGHLGMQALSQRMAVCSCNMVDSSRLARKHGVLHNLRLLMSAHSIAASLVIKNFGQLLQFNGEHIIAVFPSCNAALVCIEAIWQQVADFNKRRLNREFWIRLGCGMDFGDVLVLGEDLLGSPGELSLYLAEEVSKASEVLITEDFRRGVTAWNTLPARVHLSGECVAEHPVHGHVSYRNISL